MTNLHTSYKFQFLKRKSLIILLKGQLLTILLEMAHATCTLLLATSEFSIVTNDNFMFLIDSHRLGSANNAYFTS